MTIHLQYIWTFFIYTLQHVHSQDSICIYIYIMHCIYVFLIRNRYNIDSIHVLPRTPWWTFDKVTCDNLEKTAHVFGNRIDLVSTIFTAHLGKIPILTNISVEGVGSTTNYCSFCWLVTLKLGGFNDLIWGGYVSGKLNPPTTWRIIPVRKWLITMVIVFVP